jgi:hypothetical protein
MPLRYLKRSVLWLLPLLALRAFVPVGYMLSANAAGLQLTFCPGVVAPHASIAQGAVDHSAHQHHQLDQSATAHADHHAGHSSGEHDDAPCPYSMGAAAGPQHIAFFAADDLPVVDEPIAFSSRPIVAIGPLRADRIRGPPLS